MNCIPPKLKQEMAEDPFYKKCCITGTPATSAKIDWHHGLTYAGKQLQERFAIIPLRKDIHDNIVLYREKCDWIILNRANDQQLKKYSKAIDLTAKRDRLNKKYGDK
jgi:hypothetical protein